MNESQPIGIPEPKGRIDQALTRLQDRLQQHIQPLQDRFDAFLGAPNPDNIPNLPVEQKDLLSRRRFLRMTAAGLTGIALAACGEGVTTTPGPGVEVAPPGSVEQQPSQRGMINYVELSADKLIPDTLGKINGAIAKANNGEAHPVTSVIGIEAIDEKDENKIAVFNFIRTDDPEKDYVYFPTGVNDFALDSYKVNAVYNESLNAYTVEYQASEGGSFLTLVLDNSIRMAPEETPEQFREKVMKAIRPAEGQINKVDRIVVTNLASNDTAQTQVKGNETVVDKFLDFFADTASAEELPDGVAATATPKASATAKPTEKPTEAATTQPTDKPKTPTNEPTEAPTEQPTVAPTETKEAYKSDAEKIKETTSYEIELYGHKINVTMGVHESMQDDLAGLDLNDEFWDQPEQRGTGAAKKDLERIVREMHLEAFNRDQWRKRGSLVNDKDNLTMEQFQAKIDAGEDVSYEVTIYDPEDEDQKATQTIKVDPVKTNIKLAVSEKLLGMNTIQISNGETTETEGAKFTVDKDGNFTIIALLPAYEFKNGKDWVDFRPYRDYMGLMAGYRLLDGMFSLGAVTELDEIPNTGQIAKYRDFRDRRKYGVDTNGNEIVGLLNHLRPVYEIAERIDADREMVYTFFDAVTKE